MRMSRASHPGALQETMARTASSRHGRRQGNRGLEPEFSTCALFDKAPKWEESSREGLNEEGSTHCLDPAQNDCMLYIASQYNVRGSLSGIPSFYQEDLPGRVFSNNTSQQVTNQLTILNLIL